MSQSYISIQSYFSPAKINLFFHIFRKQEDGYHEIHTHMRAISLGDTISLYRSSEDRLTCSDSSLETSDNLIRKAWQLFQRFYPCAPLHIHLEKKIPVGSGLGGGSSNAATTLWALNEWAGRPASLEELGNLGAQLGSDVSFFFSLGSAECRGRGEQLSLCPYIPLSGWLYTPSYGVSTIKAYQETKPQDWMHESNDLEAAVCRIEPRLVELRMELQTLSPKIYMSGSGSTFFSLQPPVPKIGKSFHAIERLASDWYKI